MVGKPRRCDGEIDLDKVGEARGDPKPHHDRLLCLDNIN